MSNFTEEVIHGKKYKTMLPDKTALVLEGGGMRGFYSAGVLDAFMEEGIMFPYIVSVSAGSANVLSYISGQIGRNRIIVEKYVSDKKYSSIRNWIFKKSFFDFDYAFKEIPQKHLYFDRRIFKKTKTRLLTGATQCNSGKIKWFEKDELGEDFIPTIASCSVPLFSKIVNINGLELLDGGIAAPIPIEKSIEDGNEFHVIVLTRNIGYLKPPIKPKWLVKRKYKNYPKLVDALIKRHEMYNKQLELCEKLENEGKAIIIRPEEKLKVDRYNKNAIKLLKLYDEGILEGRLAVKMIKRKWDVK